MSLRDRMAGIPLLGVAVRHPQYRRLWLAQIVSLLGDWLNRIACLSLIKELGGTHAAIGIGMLYAFEVAIRLLPITIFGPIAGPVVDRFPRGRVMMCADGLRSVIVLGFLFVDETSEIPLLMGLLFCQMAVSIFFDAANSSSVARLVPKEEYHEAYALSAITWSTMLAVGAVLGGLLVVLLGLRGAFLCDAASYLVSLAILSRTVIPATKGRIQRLELRRIVRFTDMREGFRHVQKLRILPVIFAKASWSCAGGFLVVLAISASGPLAGNGLEAGFVLGVLYAARGVGTGLGPLLARRFLGNDEAALKKHIRYGCLVGILGYFLFVRCTSLPLAAACVTLSHFGGSALWVASTSWYQRHIEDAFRGRVYTLEWLAATLASALGALLAGFVYDLTGSLHLSAWLVCGCIAIGTTLWTLSARHLPHRPSP